jgi:hypothetical protein
VESGAVIMKQAILLTYTACGKISTFHNALIVSALTQGVESGAVIFAVGDLTKSKSI